jgi:beta-glucanase (GH16 family)
LSPQASHCDRGATSPVTAAGLLPFLLALVMAVPLARGAGTVAVADATAGSDIAAAVNAPLTAGPSTAPAAGQPTSDVVAPVAGPASPAATGPAGAAAPPSFIGPVAPVVAPLASVGVTESAASAPALAPAAAPADVASAASPASRSIAPWRFWKDGTAPRPSAAPTAGNAADVRTAAQSSNAEAEGVLNPAGSAGTNGWQADSAAGPVSVSRVAGISGPFTHTTAVQFNRAGGSGDWARALAAISSPARFFTPGRSYTMSAWVRDLNASGKSVGLLVADGAYQNRPTEMSIYEGHNDKSWHLLSRTFTANAKGSADTGIYLALPESGAVAIQVTGVSVREVTVAGPAQVTRPASRTLTFDGAAGQAVDPATWNHETGGNGWGNGELQTYTDRTSNAHLDGAGNLVITARRETYAASDGITRKYTSARLSTEGKMIIQPGSYVEASITAPVGKSVWPAFWLIGANIRQVGWPASGELDVLEGSGGQPTKAFNAAHMAKIGDSGTDMQYGWGEGGGTVDLGHALDSAAHLYGVYFDGSTVRFYVDRREVRSLYADQAAASGRAWPFGKPQYVVLNVAVDGDSGDPLTTSFPRSMTVGNISVWQGGVPF